MGKAGGSSKIRKILWAEVWDGERGDTGGPILTNNFQHNGGVSDKGGSVGITLASGGTSRVGMGNG